MSQSLNKSAFYAINVSDKNVCLSDLALTIPARRCYNLLDQKHFSYTIEELKASMESGSLQRKKHLIKIGKGKPQVVEPLKRVLSEYPMVVRSRSAVIVEEEKYDELYDDVMISDEKYVEDMMKEFDEEDKI